MDIFDRFVKAFPELLDAEEALRLWRSLHAPAPASAAEPLCFGVRELSVSLQARGATSLRWLAEAYRRQPFDASTAAQARSLAHGVFSTLRELYGAAPPQERFDRLFDIAYPAEERSGLRPTFRIGYAVELRRDRPPGFKWYAEPRTAGPDGAAARFTAIASALGLETHLQRADAAIRSRLPAASLRGFGVDLSVQDVPNLKVYYAVRGCGWSQLRDLARPADAGPDPWPLEPFHRLILKQRQRMPPNAILLAVVLAPFLDPDTPTLKWDVYLPQLHTGDAPVQARLLRLCHELGLDPDDYLRLWSVAAGSTRSDALVHVHQYASLDLAPDGDTKLNVYLRAPEQVTEHMPLRMRPRRLRAPDGLELCVTAVQRGLVALADAAESGYAELTHSMVFPREEGFRGSGRPVHGSVFQRATLCRALASARSRYDIDEPGLRAQLDDLASQQDPGSGGWKYFPDLAELPPDADDLAQVLLAFVELRDPRAEEIFSRILDRVERLADPGGWLPTWLVDPAAPDPDSSLYRQAIARWWGEGPDPEVVANLAYALARLDPVRFGDLALRACDWLASVQRPDGLWESTWYWGRMYGTALALRLFAALRPRDVAVSRAAQGWIESQGEEGGFGPCLETAFGLQAGVELARAGLLDRQARRLVRAAAWICERQSQDGTWAAAPWIRMDLRRAENQRSGGPPRFLSHGSGILSTVLCVQALLDLLGLQAAT
jgi:squalene-hopene/tetraprenyl-beta-curcumene cyclase